MVESKYKNETANLLDQETLGVPKFKNRLAYYLFMINKTRLLKKKNLISLQKTLPNRKALN
jgi:hypothetical protein